MATKTITTRIQLGRIYHIFNRGVNHGQIFFQASDYKLFMSLFKKFVLPGVELLAFCLIPNHYHFVLIVDPIKQDVDFSTRFASFLKSYTYHMNKKYNRRGTLFQGKFRRLLVEDEENLRSLITYTHMNPLKHKVSMDYQKFEHNSYSHYQNPNQDLISTEYIIRLFDDLDNFNEVHRIAAMQYNRNRNP